MVSIFNIKLNAKLLLKYLQLPSEVASALQTFILKRQACDYNLHVKSSMSS